MKVDVYNTTGKKSGTAEVADAVFAAAWRPELVHQVVTAMRANQRQSTAHTKDRSEVSGGGKKPWRQKGTGRARHGSRRSPIWVGGGTTFGPRSEKDYSQKINKKMRTGALASLLSVKVRDGQILFVDSIAIGAPKTKEAEAALRGLESVEGFTTLNTRTNSNNVLVVMPTATDEVLLAMRNLPHVSIEQVDRLDALQVAQARYVVLVDPAASSSVLQQRIEGTLSARQAPVAGATVTA